jgi:predicted extracellular nuclease
MKSALRLLVSSGLATAGLVALPLSPAVAAGTVSLIALDTAYTQDFDTLVSTGSSSTLPAGWDIAETGTNANTSYTAGTGSSATGDTYSFGATASVERAYGTLRSGSLVPVIGAGFTNDTGSQVSTLAIAYAGEHWRLGVTDRGAADRLDFQYSLDATSLTSGTWVSVDSLDFATPNSSGTAGARDGNNAANRTLLSATVQGLAIAPAATFWIRWTDFDITSSDDGLAVDDFSLTPGFADSAPSVTATSPVAGAVDVPRAANVTVTFSEPVDVTDPWFQIVCADSGVHTATASGGPTTFVLDPQTDFASSELCTVTVFASAVTDQDADDPPDAMAGDASFSFTTVDEVNCGAPATLIHDVQGSGPTSPLAGTTVQVEGVVVGDLQGPGQFGGYYLQEEDSDADADASTSEGVFVLSSAPDVSLGDRVRVRGTVGESSGLTRLTGVIAAACSTGNTVTPAAVSLPVAAIADWERHEGMSVAIDQELTVTEVFTLARFGEVSLSVGGRLANPTNVVDPGAPAQALQSLNDRSRILLDDGNNSQNIDPTFYPAGGLSASNTLRVGDTTPSLTGVLDFRFGVYRMQPSDPTQIGFVHSNPRPESPDAVGGNARVGAFNVLNYFNGDGAGGGFPTARGATTPAEFDRQRAKIISAITELDADVLGLMELENDDSDSEYGAIEDLVAGLNAVAGAGTYAYVDTGIVGTDAIRVGIIYQPARVSLVGPHAILDSAVDPRFIDTLNRPSLAQTFERNGDRFTVVVNHLKSKGSDCNAVGDPDTGDGQGNCNGIRTLAAEALVDWIATDPTGSGDSDALVIGDMNAYAKEDPIATFEAAGYTNTIASFLGSDAYSFVFQGQSGYLDHALASPALSAKVAGVSEWHTNADEPIALDYNVEFKSPGQVTSFYAPDAFRSSDHDPVLVGLNLNSVPSVDAGGPYAVVEGGSVVVTATGGDPDGDPLTYAWDLDDNGTFETPGPSATFSAALLQAPAERTIRVRVSDGSSTATDTATVTVIWAFTGFFEPIDNVPDVNAVKAGSTLPLRFSLGGDQGLGILAVGSPASIAYDCVTGSPIGPLEQTSPTVKRGLTYDAATGTYVYTWRTTKAWSGCRRFVLTLADGTVHDALFRFVK